MTNLRRHHDDRHLLLILPGMARKDRRRRNRKSWSGTQHQVTTRSSSEVETCVRTVQLRSTPTPPRSPSVQAISVLTRVGTSCSRADRSRSHHSMSRQQRVGARSEVRSKARSEARSRSRSRSELPNRCSREGSRESRVGSRESRVSKVQPPRRHISQPCSEKQRPAPTPGSAGQNMSTADQAIPTYQDLAVHIVARRVHDLQAALMMCPAKFRTDLEDQLASANLALRQRKNHQQSHLVLSTQTLVLRGEESREFPLEVPSVTEHCGLSSTFLAPVPVTSAKKQKK